MDDVSLFTGTPPESPAEQMEQQPQGQVEQPVAQPQQEAEGAEEEEGGRKGVTLPCPGSVALIVMAAVVHLLRNR